MEKEDVKRAAQEAINDLQLDCEITEITRPLGKDTWCIQFAGTFGQFCDEFHDKAGKDNSARLMREKIKRFFLKQRKPMRIVRGRSPSARERRKGEGDLLGTLMEAGGQALKEASRITGEVIERATVLNQAALKTGAEWMEGISPTAAELIRPDSPGSASALGPPPQREVEPVSHEALKPDPPTIKSTRKAKAKAAVKATKTKRTRASEDSLSRTGKKRVAKKAAKKSAAKKRSRKAGKKTSGKKSSSKSRR